MHIRQSLTVMSMILLGLTGCTEASKGWPHRYGPNPTMPNDSVNKHIGNQNKIMTEFADATGLKNDDDDYFYYTTLAGFNYVDEQCDLYLKELFLIDKSRSRLKRNLDTANTTSSAILLATSASQKSMAILAQAFGLTSQFSDTWADSYLYGVKASTVHGVVSKLQDAYRIKTVADKDSIKSQPVAYARIRGYLQLCMPPVIESQIESAVTAANATVVPKPAEKATQVSTFKLSSGGTPQNQKSNTTASEVSPRVILTAPSSNAF